MYKVQLLNYKIIVVISSRTNLNDYSLFWPKIKFSDFIRTLMLKKRTSVGVKVYTSLENVFTGGLMLSLTSIIMGWFGVALLNSCISFLGPPTPNTLTVYILFYDAAFSTFSDLHAECAPKAFKIVMMWPNISDQSFEYRASFKEKKKDTIWPFDNLP